MEFLDTLFRYEYFGPILFGVIAFLIILFFIILFFGKKEEQVRKLEETRRLELANANAFKEESDSIKLEAPVFEESFVPQIETPVVAEEPVVGANTVNPFDTLSDFGNDAVEEKIELEEIQPAQEVVAPVLEPIKTIPLNTFENQVVESTVVAPLIDKTPVKDIVDEVPTQDVPQRKENFDDILSSLAKEIEDLEKMADKRVKEDNIPKGIENSKIDVTPISVIKPKNPMPVFSSVFVDSNKQINEEDNSTSLTTETPEVAQVVVEEKKEENVTFDFSKLKGETKSVVKPAIELPKAVEMPVKKSEVVEDVSISTPDFTNFEGESYTLK